MTRDWTQKYFDIKGDEPDAYEEIKSELSKVKKQLAIAVEALEYYENKDNYDRHHQVIKGNNEWDSNVMIDCGNKAEQALNQIKELNK